MPRTITIPTAAVSDSMAAYTVGFAKLQVQNRIEDAVGAGSGTLVSVGKVCGGWHRDKPHFDGIFGLSLGSACKFRFRRTAGRRGIVLRSMPNPARFT
jgi:hypothetical protein